MKKQMAALAVVLFAASAAADSWDDVLEQGGLTRSRVQFDTLHQEQFAASQLQIPFWKALHDEPLRIPAYVRVFRQSLLEKSAQPQELTMALLGHLGLGVRRTLVADPLRNAQALSLQPNGLGEAIARIHRDAHRPLSASRQKELKARLEKLPPELAQTAAYLVESERLALQWRTQSLAAIPHRVLREAFRERTLPLRAEDPNGDEVVSRLLRRLIREVDLQDLMIGGIDLSHGVAQAVAALKDKRFTNVSRFEWATPLGDIVIGSSGCDTYPANRPYLLIIDAGGDDVYYGGGGTFDEDHPVSVLLDLAGDDKYLAKPALANIGGEKERKADRVTPLFGAGVFGYGILADLGGNDVYRSFRHTQGRGDFGVGVLWDLAGNDEYDSYTQSQGSGDFGVGILSDGGGTDRYSAFQFAQGYGGPRGSGLLIDSGGNADTYAANNRQIDYPALIDKTFNTSFAQGAAAGVRADFSDGFSLAGGLGALVDGGGDNSFAAGFFAQGITYWYGVGILSVGDGNDRYEAGKYAQGAAAHFGVGILHDTGGNDSYRVAQELGIGEGHDYGVGFLLEDGGNDRYAAPNLSLGCGSGNGMGFFWDRSGDDEYDTAAPASMGCALYRSSKFWRKFNSTLGVFLDTGGRNRFPHAERKGAWGGTQKSEEGAPLIGIGRIADHPGTADPW